MDIFSDHCHIKRDSSTYPELISDDLERTCDKLLSQSIQELYLRSAFDIQSSTVIDIDTYEGTSSSTDVLLDVDDKYKTLISKYPWTHSFYYSALKLKSSKCLIPYYKEINKLLADSENSHDCIDALLYYAEPKYLSDVLLPGLLRLTYSKRDDLPSWYRLRDSVEKELGKRGLDVDRTLKGLR